MGVGAGPTFSTSAESLVPSIAVRARTSPQNNPQPSTSDDDFEDVKEDIRSSSSDDDDNCDAANGDRSSSAASSGHPFDGMVFTSRKDITNAVHCEALRHNKQVSCTASFSGNKKKVYKCVALSWLRQAPKLVFSNGRQTIEDKTKDTREIEIITKKQ